MSNKGKEIYPLDLIMKLIGGNHFIAVLRTEDKSPSVEDEKYIYIYIFLQEVWLQRKRDIQQ